MSSGSREQIGQSGSRRTFSSVVVASSASYISSRPMSGSPAPVTSLMTSVACSRPIVPGSTPSTPLAPQEGASSAGGGPGGEAGGHGVQAAVARAVVRLEDGELAVEAEDRGGDDRDAEPHGGVVEQVAGRE